MPTPAPKIGDPSAAALSALGQRLRAHRQRQKISAVAAAEAAGLSRVTLYRIERGEPSVTMGAYLSVIHALGLELTLADPADRPAAPALPERIRVADFPELRRLAWQRGDSTELTPKEALALYERNWRHVDTQALTAPERALIDVLAAHFASGRLLVRP